MSFKVTQIAPANGETVKFYMSLPQAIHGARLAAYTTLEAFGKLDTEAAHKVMADLAAVQDDFTRFAVAKSRRVVISNTGYQLMVENTKRR